MTRANRPESDAFAIRFKLRPIDGIAPWGEPGQQRLHWFGLTDGCYCIDTPAGRLLEHDGAAAPDLGEPWCDYQVVRLFEDLLEIWPAVREEVPPDVATRYLAFDAREGARITDTDDDALYEVWGEASSWWHARKLDFSYLSGPPKLHLWRTESQAHLSWSAAKPWLPPSADVSVAFAAVEAAVTNFAGALLAAMAERVMAISTANWQPANATLDIEALLAEQRMREASAQAALADVRHTDWDLVRRRLNELGA